MTYTDSVANSVSSITVTPTAVDSDATITVNGIPTSNGTPSQLIDLNEGTSTIIIVTAESGTTKTYTIIVTKQ
jgi:hypothetical protein